MDAWNRSTAQAAMTGLLLASSNMFGDVIPVTDANLRDGLSPYNWVCKDDYVSSSVNGASLTLQLKGTHQVALQVATDNLTAKAAGRMPIIAWSVNDGAMQTHQVVAGETSVVLSASVADARIEVNQLYP